VQDEFYWAAAELYITTGKDEYRAFVKGSRYFQRFGSASSISWDNTAALGSISLALVPNGLSDDEIAELRDQLVQVSNDYMDTIQAEGYRAPLKASDYVWGSNAVLLNNAIILALAYDFSGNEHYLEGVIASMNYVLGNNAVDQSFVSGYGTLSMQHPHHRFWGSQPAQGFPPPPPGAVSGGPNGTPSDNTAIRLVSDLPIARRYIDDIGSFSTNEVAINWNAPLVWVAAYLDAHFNSGS
jgi:endoglucanase